MGVCLTPVVEFKPTRFFVDGLCRIFKDGLGYSGWYRTRSREC